MKPAILVILGLVIASSAYAAQLTVFTAIAPDQTAAHFKGKKTFVFEALPNGQFKAPKVSKWARLDIPASIRAEAKPHNVEVGAIVSAKGRVLAAAVVSSDCAALEGPAKAFAKDLEFTPATVDGKPICYFCIVPVSYRFEGETK